MPQSERRCAPGSSHNGSSALKGFVRIGLSTYQMYEVSAEEMDALIASGGDSWQWPLRFDDRERVWPIPHEGWEVVFTVGAIHEDVKDIKQLLRMPQDQRR